MTDTTTAQQVEEESRTEELLHEQSEMSANPDTSADDDTARALAEKLEQFPPKCASYGALRMAGLPQRVAREKAGLSERGARDAERRVRPALLAPLVPGVKRALRSLVAGQQVGHAKPRAQDVLRACELVLEREAPAVHRTASVSATVDMPAEERARMRAALGLPPQAAAAAPPPGAASPGGAQQVT